MDSPAQITDQTPKEKPVVITSSNIKKNMFKFSFVNPKILGAMTVMLLLIGGVGTGVYLTQNRQQTVSQAALTGVDLTFKPDQIQANTSSEFSVDVFANSNDNKITSAYLSIKYNPQILTLKSITPGQFLPKILVAPQINSGSALVSLGTDGNSGVTGSGVIAGLIFETNSQASQTPSQITFDPQETKIKVLNRSEEKTNDTFGNISVTVSQASPSPSPSPSPSIPPSSSAAASSEPSAQTQSSNSADFNNDGQVNAVDLSIMYSGWGEPKTEIQKKADLNQDGKVNGVDFAMFKLKFHT